MTDARHLTAEIDAFARIVDELRAIASRTDSARRGELITLRRQLAEKIAILRDSGVQTFIDPALSSEFRTRLSHVLNLMATHQAKWPAVAINQDEIAYRNSAEELTAANRAFVDWIRAALARRP